MNKPLRILSLGWGIQSWTLAAMAALEEIPPVDYAIHADTTHEHVGTYEHAAKWTPWLEEHGVKVVTVRGRRTDVIQRWESSTAGIMIPAYTAALTGKKGQLARQCTRTWKVDPIRRIVSQFLKAAGIPKRPGAVHSLQGISLDEWRRMRPSDVKYIENIYPLVDMRITRAACVAWLDRHELDVPPKSSCVFCPYKSIESWKELKRVGGPDWDAAVEADNAVRPMRDNFPLFLHPGRKPLPEAISIPEDEGAHQLELDLPCDSGYCFT